MTKLKEAQKRIKVLEQHLKDNNIDCDIEDRKPFPTIGAAQRTARIAGFVDDRVPTLPAWACVLLAYVILVTAHFLIIIQFDLLLIYLRICSIVIPVFFGFMYRNSLDRALLWDLGIGLLLAVASVLTMSAVLAKTDTRPILPQDLRGWQESVEYAASIGFGFFTGCALRHGFMLIRSPSPRLGYLVELIARLIARKLWKKTDSGVGPEPTQDEVDTQAKKIESLISASIAAGSIGLSMYTGLSGLLRMGS